MTNAVETKGDVANGRADPVKKESSDSGLNPYLIGLMILGVAALIAYQFFGCAGCYGRTIAP